MSDINRTKHPEPGPNPPVLCVLDLWSGVSARLRQSVACASGCNRLACGSADHHAALLPRKSPVPPHRAQPGRRGSKRSRDMMAALKFNETECRMIFF